MIPKGIRFIVGRVRTCRRVLVGLCLFVIAGATGPAVAGQTHNPLIPTTNPVEVARMGERAEYFANPQFQTLVLRDALKQVASRVAIHANDPERNPDPNSCTLVLPCVGDPRLDDFTAHGGIEKPVLFTARSGATLSGHLWATRTGPKKRPLVVILNGSLIDFEQGHWPEAQVLAKRGYVVMTFDTQGEGASDQFGQGKDLLDSVSAGVPGVPNNGRPFYDGLEDALDFALSTPGHPYLPVLSSGSHTSHAAKQKRRVREHLDAAYDPLWRMVDPRHVGVTGYSYGAVAASYVAQADHRVDAVVAWDSLCVPVQPSPTEIKGLFLTNPVTVAPGVTFPLGAQIPTDCFGAPPGRAVKPRVPSLGISGDFVLPGLISSNQDRSKAAASRIYSAHGVDSGQIVIQGATHADFVFVGGIAALPATLRGLDLTAWYTLAWFDKYLKHLPSADAMLTSAMWRHDATTAKVDPVHDGNMYSQIYDSRLDIHLANGRRWDCENLRKGCKPVGSWNVPFSYLSVATH